MFQVDKYLTLVSEQDYEDLTPKKPTIKGKPNLSFTSEWIESVWEDTVSECRKSLTKSDIHADFSACGKDMVECASFLCSNVDFLVEVKSCV